MLYQQVFRLHLSSVLKNPYKKEIKDATSAATPHTIIVAVVSLEPVPLFEFCSPILRFSDGSLEDWGECDFPWTIHVSENI